VNLGIALVVPVWHIKEGINKGVTTNACSALR